MASLEFTAGAIHWRFIRDLVSRLKFEGADIELWESSGFLSRDFAIKGDEAVLIKIQEYLLSMKEKVNE